MGQSPAPGGSQHPRFRDPDLPPGWRPSLCSGCPSRGRGWHPAAQRGARPQKPTQPPHCTQQPQCRAAPAHLRPGRILHPWDSISPLPDRAEERTPQLQLLNALSPQLQVMMPIPILILIPIPAGPSPAPSSSPSCAPLSPSQCQSHVPSPCQGQRPQTRSGFV